MYLLDTNVISELRKVRNGKAHPHVAQWIKSVSPKSLYLSVIVIPELQYGTLLLARRDPIQGQLLNTWIHEFVLTAFHFTDNHRDHSTLCRITHSQPTPRNGYFYCSNSTCS